MTTPVNSGARAVEHGGLRPAELRGLGIDPASVVDFSANVNPLGPSPRVRQALATLDPSRYPDPEALELRTALAERNGVRLDQVWAGNGATELIHLVARAFLDRRDLVAVLSPTFGEYERAASLARAEVARLPRAPVTRWDAGELARQLRTLGPLVTFCCNPNNPTGQYLLEHEMRGLLDATAPGLFVLDESYVAFVRWPWSSSALGGLVDSGRALVLRSLTKDLALPGLRLGYVIGSAELVEAIAGQQPSWSVNAAAQAAGLAALGDSEHERRSLAAMAEGRLALVDGLARLGLPFETPAANFVLVEVGDVTGSGRSAAVVRLGLARRGFLVRDCASFGLPAHIRIAARSAPECGALVRALGEVVRR